MEHNGVNKQMKGTEMSSKRMEWALEAGITEKTEPKEFVTREETIDMIHRALEYFFQRIICILQEQ